MSPGSGGAGAVAGCPCELTADAGMPVRVDTLPSPDAAGQGQATVLRAGRYSDARHPRGAETRPKPAPFQASDRAGQSRLDGAELITQHCFHPVRERNRPAGRCLHSAASRTMSTSLNSQTWFLQSQAQAEAVVHGVLCQAWGPQTHTTPDQSTCLTSHSCFFVDSVGIFFLFSFLVIKNK